MGTQVAASTHDLRKVYGKGEAQVAALDGNWNSQQAKAAYVAAGALTRRLVAGT